jgi:hypothetical protein
VLKSHDDVTSSPPTLRSYRQSDRDALVALWSACGLLRPSNDPDRDIERKLAHDNDLLVLELEDRLIGSARSDTTGIVDG